MTIIDEVDFNTKDSSLLGISCTVYCCVGYVSDVVSSTNQMMLGMYQSHYLRHVPVTCWACTSHLLSVYQSPIGRVPVT